MGNEGAKEISGDAVPPCRTATDKDTINGRNLLKEGNYLSISD